MTHVAVIGAYGSAGVAAAETLAEASDIDQLTLFDDGDPGGGLCILRGCMPSKAVLSAAGHRFQARSDDRLGPAPDVDLQRTVERKTDRVLGFAEHRRAAVRDLAERDGVTFRHERARLADHPKNADPTADELVLTAGDDRLAVDAVCLATGSRVSAPDLPGIDDVGYWTSRDVLDATDLPDSGVVMGFGYVGIELVPYLAEAGMDLTVIEHDARPLERAAPELGDTILELYRDAFDVEIRTHAEEQSVERTADGQVRLHLERTPPADEPTLERVTADALFAFTGREPALDVGLEHTAVQPRDGWVAPTMQSEDDPRVFVAGDAIGDRMLLHTAKEEGRIAGQNLALTLADSPDPLTEYDPFHHSVMFAGTGIYPYTSVGMTAEEARDAGHDPIVTTRAASDDGVFKVKDVPHGRARLVVAQDGTVLGYHGIHHGADVLAKALQIVLAQDLTVREIPDRAFHPTTPEIFDGLLRDAKAALD